MPLLWYSTLNWNLGRNHCWSHLSVYTYCAHWHQHRPSSQLIILTHRFSSRVHWEHRGLLAPYQSAHTAARVCGPGQSWASATCSNNLRKVSTYVSSNLCKHLHPQGQRLEEVFPPLWSIADACTQHLISGAQSSAVSVQSRARALRFSISVSWSTFISITLFLCQTRQSRRSTQRWRFLHFLLLYWQHVFFMKSFW